MYVIRQVILELFMNLDKKRVKRVTRTKIMKLAYLIERECRITLKRTCTTKDWIMWWYGPFSKKVLDELDELEIKGIIDSNIKMEKDKKIIEYKLKKQISRSQASGNYDPIISSIIEKVVRKWGRKSLDEILEYIYELDEIKRTGIGEPLFPNKP